MPAPPQEAAGIDDADAPERGPLRRCIVTRAQGPRAEMLRFVVGPAGDLVPDLAARLPGRGLWLSARADVLSHPRTRQAFSRAARMRVTVPDDLAGRVADGLRQRLIDLLGLARRAGQAVAGFQRAQEWLEAGRAALIVEASDGSAAERARFLGRQTHVPVIAPVPASRLGPVFGRTVAVHVAVAPGKLAEALLIEAARLAGVDGGGAMAPVPPALAAGEDLDG